jgi:transcriptional regulator, araC family
MHTRNLLSNLTNNDLAYISKTNIGEDFSASFHSHPNLEILLVTEGEGKIAHTHQSIPIIKGDIIVISKNSKHCEITTKNLTFFAIGVNNIDAFLKHNFTDQIFHLHLEDEEFKTILQLYQIIFSESELKHEKNIISPLFISIINIIERNSALSFDKSHGMSYNSNVNTVISFIDNYFYLKLPLKTIAERLSISVSGLCHQFKEETKMTVGEYKLSKQINEAMSLLETTDMSIMDIASMVGFNDSAYFTKQFKATSGMTPKEYRKKQINNEN